MRGRDGAKLSQNRDFAAHVHLMQRRRIAVVHKAPRPQTYRAIGTVADGGVPAMGLAPRFGKDFPRSPERRANAVLEADGSGALM